jgi:hypothetical protein
MADLKISQLTGATTPLAGTEVLPIVQSGSTVKVSINDLTAGRATSMAGASITGAGTSIDFSGTTQRFTANTTGATVNDRFAFVTNQANSTTRFNAAPNGTGTACSLNAFNNSNLNNASVAALIASSTAVTLSSGITGTGTYLPLYVTTSGANRIEVSTAGDVTINAGNLIQGTAGKGIDFTANTNAPGMTSELLNWYEEGTFTATYTGTGSAPTTPVTTTARYTRVGRLVTVHIGFVNPFSTAGATGNVQVTGLPFTSGYTAICPVLLGDNLGTVAVGYLTNSSTTISLVNPGDLATPIAVKNTIYSYMNITLSYTV